MFSCKGYATIMSITIFSLVDHLFLRFTSIIKICPHPTNEKNFSIKFSQIGDCNVPQDIISVIRPETISPGPLIFKNVRKISSGLILDTYYVWKRHAMPFLVSVWIFFFSKTLNLHALLGGFMFESPKTY